MTGPPRRAATGDSGYVTAETALALPSLMAVFFVLLLIVLAAGDQIRCADAAWEAARLAARGEPADLAATDAKRWAPPGAEVSVAPEDGSAHATVSVRVGLGGLRLPALRISSTAQVTCEAGVTCSPGDS